MSETKTVMVIYNGYIGDSHWLNLVSKGREPFIPGTKMSCVRYVDWRSTKGFGPGYFKNSGLYAASFNLKVPVDQEIDLGTGCEIFDDQVKFTAKIKALSVHSKMMNKQNPY